MAEKIFWQVSTIPRVAEDVAAQPTDGFRLRTPMTATEYNALKLLIQKLQVGTDISTVITAINALP